MKDYRYLDRYWSYPELAMDANWNEQLHPRKGGKFAPKGTGGAGGGKLPWLPKKKDLGGGGYEAYWPRMQQMINKLPPRLKNALNSTSGKSFLHEFMKKQPTPGYQKKLDQKAMRRERQGLESIQK
jgi:hypothetical protein